MKVFVLAGGRTKPEYWGARTEPKPLIVLGQNSDGLDVTILDLQMEMYRKFSLDPYFIIGYEGKLVEQHCLDRGYDVGILEDHTWDKEYTVNRTLGEVDWFISEVAEPFLLIHGDLIFREPLLEYLTTYTEDICNANSDGMAFRLSPHAYKEMMIAFRDNPDLDGMNHPLWRLLEGKVSFGKSPIIWQFDVDNPVEYMKAKAMVRSRLG